MAIFAVIVLAVGRGKGGWSLLGLGYTVFVILFFLVQAIFHGWNVMGSVVATVAVGTFAALGAVMDVGMSVAASLEEIHTLNPALNARALMGSGMRIGRDMIGTMTNTLILAYTGTALTTMILLLAYGYDMGHLLSSDYLAMELAQGIASTGGVVLTVPMASVISALVYTREKKKA